ncbi:hypothetical protein F5Y16DRAFT_71434 [Xylariaceae sp. FL0255]|nr:hypothetical protein F5Y16DRAFT_71434 [Xylariaceae sp. FL0255]
MMRIPLSPQHACIRKLKTSYQLWYRNGRLLIVVYNNGEGYVGCAVKRIRTMGYDNVYTLDGGLVVYAKHGRLFQDVSVSSKALGQLLEAIRHTRSIPALEIGRIFKSDTNAVVLDARRYEEYYTMSLPGGTELSWWRALSNLRGDASPRNHNH